MPRKTSRPKNSVRCRNADGANRRPRNRGQSTNMKFKAQSR